MSEPPRRGARQPLLHAEVVALAAPVQAWGAPDGDVGRPGASGVHGYYTGDQRVVSRVLLSVEGSAVEPIGHVVESAGTVRSTALLRGLDGPGADPDVRLERVRRVTAASVREEVEVTSRLADGREVELALRVAPDAAGMDVVKSGGAPVPVTAVLVPGGEPGREPGATWRAGEAEAHLRAPGAHVRLDGDDLVLTWRGTVLRGRPLRAELVVELAAPRAVVRAVVRGAGSPRPWRVPEVADDRLRRWLERASDDLDALRMRLADPRAGTSAGEDEFLAAGAPWFFTLFGRDALWAARFLLPAGGALAAGTLRSLAALQGSRTDAASGEEPGKVLHELRQAALALVDGEVALPPRYYGSVDATPLWVVLLHDAWRAGMPTDGVAALLPAAERALAWMRDSGDADGDGLLEYVDATGRGLANQGWKDSGDSVQWRDGRLARAPIALCEVQAYAHEAALGGAALLEAFGRPGAREWRAWAARLAGRFREAFWVRDERGPHPAIALDADKRPVDSLTSNTGHLLGTGLLSPAEELLVADRLLAPDLASGFGLRTLSTTAAGYWPLSYHGGSVWTHDTAVAVSGLARAGLDDHARALAEQLLAAAAAFDSRVPELHSGDAADGVRAPAPYPAACRPQAWSAAAAFVVADVLGR